MDTSLFLTVLTSAIVAMLFLVGAASVMAVFKGAFAIRSYGAGSIRDDGATLLKSPLVPTVSMMAVVNDASPSSVGFVRRLISLHYGNIETVVVLNGLSGEQRAVWFERFRLSPSSRVAGAAPVLPLIGVYEPPNPIRLLVVERELGSEAECLDTGLKAVASSIVGLVDPSLEFTPDALLRLVRPFLQDPKRTLAVCSLAAAPPRPGWLCRLKELEAVRSWSGRCAAVAHWGALIPPPACFLLFDAATVAKAGGFQLGPMETVLRLHRYARASGLSYHVAFVPETICWAGPPRSLGDLRASIVSEQRELTRALWRHRSLILGTDALRLAGVGGLFVIRCVRPLAETLAYGLGAFGLVTGRIPAALAGLVLVSAVGFGILTSLIAVVGREFSGDAPEHGPGHLAALFFTAFVESLGYRQLRNLWLLEGMAGAILAPKRRAAGGRA